MLNCQVCEHNPTGERCELFGRVIGMHGCSSGVERKPRNNYEAIKAMNMEQMAGLFEDTGDCPPRACPHDGEGANVTRKDCLACWLDWLKEEIADA